MAVSSTVRPPRHGLPRPKFHSQVLTSYTLLLRLPSEAAVSAQPMGNPETLVLAELVWDYRRQVASQKQRDEEDSAYHVVNWSHIHKGTELGQARTV
jgi:hypothetical protein